MFTNSQQLHTNKQEQELNKSATAMEVKMTLIADLIG